MLCKFELDEEKFKQICKERNIPVFVFNAYDNDYPRGYVKILNVEEIKALSYGELK